MKYTEWKKQRLVSQATSAENIALARAGGYPTMSAFFADHPERIPQPEIPPIAPEDLREAIGEEAWGLIQDFLQSSSMDDGEEDSIYLKLQALGLGWSEIQAAKAHPVIH